MTGARSQSGTRVIFAPPQLLLTSQSSVHTLLQRLVQCPAYGNRLTRLTSTRNVGVAFRKARRPLRRRFSTTTINTFLSTHHLSLRCFSRCARIPLRLPLHMVTGKRRPPSCRSGQVRPRSAMPYSAPCPTLRGTSSTEASCVASRACWAILTSNPPPSME